MIFQHPYYHVLKMGKSEISAQKLFVALENIHANVEELLFLARGFHQDANSEFRNQFV